MGFLDWFHWRGPVALECGGKVAMSISDRLGLDGGDSRKILFNRRWTQIYADGRLDFGDWILD